MLDAPDGRLLDDMTAVMADFQTAGRGQVGNSWESQDGKNLLISLLHRPMGLDVGLQFYVSMSVSLAIIDVVGPLLPSNVRRSLKIKWPNDIYVAQQKLAGILIENRLSGRTISDVIIGIGLNVNQRVFCSDAPNPVSIVNLTGAEYDVYLLAEAVVNSLRRRLRQVAEGDFMMLLQEYLSKLFWADGELHSFSDANGLFSASITSVAGDGRLTLTDSHGARRSYLFKEVEHIF